MADLGLVLTPGLRPLYGVLRVEIPLSVAVGKLRGAAQSTYRRRRTLPLFLGGGVASLSIFATMS